VAAIRRAYEEGATQDALAVGFGVSQPQISRIVRREQYEE
jgi:DNA-binding transcriptional regulator LsrR (DeoR family)